MYVKTKEQENTNVILYLVNKTCSRLKTFMLSLNNTEAIYIKLCNCLF